MDPDRQAQRAAQARRFRAAVWARDKGLDRATGRPVYHVASSLAESGEVHHLRSRRVAPEIRVNLSNGILLSAESHWLADGRGGYRLKLTDPETGEPALDGTRPIRFTLYDTKGAVLWTRIG